jgi:hypothetical protein
MLKVSIHNAPFLNPFPRGREIFSKRAGALLHFCLLTYLTPLIPLSVAERGRLFLIFSPFGKEPAPM